VTLSETLLRDHADVLQAMIEHPFVRAVQAGTLSRKAFDAYLVHEGAFVGTAIGIFAHLLARADDIADQRRIIAILDALANEQIAYFERVFRTRGINPEDHPPPPSVTTFDRGMALIAHNGTFAEIATEMFAAEWMYMTWCRTVNCAAIDDADLATWVRLHTEPGFVDQANWLRRKVDEAGLKPGDDVDRCSTVFRRVLELEFAFHDAPLKAVF
jgi:thiaminase/transcriptional activator TenA